MKKRLSSKALDALEQMAIARQPGSIKSVPVGLYAPDKSLVACYRITADGTEPCDEEPVLTMPAALGSLLFPKRYKITYGGRGSAKTRTLVSLLVERSRTRFERILCCREIMKSLADSSYQEIVDEINRRGIEEEFKILESKITHLGTGATFSFEGLYRNVTKIKGYAGATLVWVEEAENVSKRSWDILTPTIRAPGSEIWVSFNPSKEDDPTYIRFVLPFLDSMKDGQYESDRHTVIKINYDQNPWFPQELEDERQDMRRTDYDRYLWIWEGEFYDHTDAQVLAGKWRVDRFDMDEFGSKRMGPRFLPDGPYYGADFGYATDPNTLVRLWIWDKRLWIDHEAYGHGIDIIDMPEFYDRIPGAKEHTIRADCARPETIAHIKRVGFKMKAAEKWPGSVEDGIAWLRSFEEIVIHERCKHTIEEASKWSYRVDKLTGDVMPKLAEGNEHLWDAVRYAAAPMIRASKSSGVRTSSIL